MIQPKPFICVLPPPISVNAMYGQAPRRRRFNSREYNDWIEDATIRLRASKPPKFTGQVWLRLTYSEACRFDTDNAHKGVIDLLKKFGVIVNDTKKYVREVRLGWGQNSGVQVEVFPFPFDQLRAKAA